VKAGESRSDTDTREPAVCRDILTKTALQALLAMQKVEGSNPFSRFQEGLHLQVFFVPAVGWCVCIAGYQMGTRRPMRGGSDSEQARLQAFPDDSNH
jgi:hypothetical protein